MTQQDQEQRMAEAQWAIRQCAIYGVPAQAISILAYECGFNRTDMRAILEELTQETA